jgi:hypothetical protein
MCPWSIEATVLMPSHFTSKPNCSSLGGSLPLRASMGLSCLESGMGSYAGSSGGSIRWIIQSLSRVRNSA